MITKAMLKNQKTLVEVIHHLISKAVKSKVNKTFTNIKNGSSSFFFYCEKIAKQKQLPFKHNEKKL